MLKVLRKARAEREEAARLAAAVTRHARSPALFTEFRVADTLDGRFDMIALHAWLYLDRLAGEGGRTRELSRKLSEAVFVGFDEALRELGVGDMGMGRRMKAMAGAYRGRLEAYAGASGPAGLAEALLRNVYRGDSTRAGDAGRLAAYALAFRARLAEAPTADLAALDLARLAS